MSDRAATETTCAPEDVFEAIVRLSFAVTAVLTRVGAAHDLSLTQLRVFGILRDHQPRMAELAEFVGLEKSTMSGLINRAEQRGIVRREPDPHDARASVVVMTAAGLELADRVLREAHAGLAPIAERMTGPERTHLVTLVATALGKAAE